MKVLNVSEAYMISKRVAAVVSKKVTMPLPALVILCLLALVVPFVIITGIILNMRSEPAQEIITVAIMKELLSASQDYYADCKRWPILDKDARALFLNDGTTNWNGPYLTRNMRKGDITDSWGSFYSAHTEGTRFYLISSGPDGKTNTADDIKGWVTPYSKMNFEGIKERSGL